MTIYLVDCLMISMTCNLLILFNSPQWRTGIPGTKKPELAGLIRLNNNMRALMSFQRNYAVTTTYNQ